MSTPRDGAGDENSARDQNVALANLRRVIDQINSIHIATIGHTGKGEKKGQRGSNAKQADDDVEVQISGDTVKVATVNKANDQQQGPLTSFSLEPYVFGLDEDGDEERTFILSRKVLAGIPTSAKKLSDKQKLAVDALANCSSQPAPAVLQLPGSIQVVAVNDWREEMYRRGVLQRDAANPRTDFQRLRDQLAAKK